MKSLRTSIFLFSFTLIGSLLSFGQQKARCPSSKYTKKAPTQEHLQKLLKAKKVQGARAISLEGLIKIPVVVHIIHNNANGIIGGTNNNNISDQQVFSQIKVLNEDFRRAEGTPGFNNNLIGADLEIEFYLATTDPNGSPSTGITRHFNPKRQWDIITETNEIANIVSWDSDRYLNIWVLSFSRSFIGYAEFPAAPVDGLNLEDPPAESDGVFLDHSVFGRQTGTAQNGPYTYGRTTTHEVGHWLGLIHIWGDEFCGTDFCEDTPTVREENLEINCDSFTTRCNDTPERAMIENYMDYSADQCMNIFTQDQKERTRAILELSKRRRRLVLSSMADLPSTETLTVKVLNHPSRKEEMRIQVLLQGFQDFSVQFYDLLGRVAEFREFQDFPSTIIEINSFNIRPGQPYIMQVKSQDQVFTKKLVIY